MKQKEKKLSEETILGHLDNILQYIENRSVSLEYIKLDEQVNMEPWPIKGWTDHTVGKR
jgi:hypothetical protein